jgi:hypothetical protein
LATYLSPFLHFNLFLLHRDRRPRPFFAFLLAADGALSRYGSGDNQSASEGEERPQGGREQGFPAAAEVRGRNGAEEREQYEGDDDAVLEPDGGEGGGAGDGIGTGHGRGIGLRDGEGDTGAADDGDQHSCSDSGSACSSGVVKAVKPSTLDVAATTDSSSSSSARFDYSPHFRPFSSAPLRSPFHSSRRFRPNTPLNSNYNLPFPPSPFLFHSPTQP